MCASRRLYNVLPCHAPAYAQVAVQLGLMEDAEQLLAECGRQDLWCKLAAAAGRWTEALGGAATWDR